MDKVFFLVIFGFCAQASESGGPLRPFLGAEKKIEKTEPLSVSYRSIQACLPRIEDERFAKKVDLQLLSEKIHGLFALQKESVLQRNIHFRDAKGIMRRFQVILQQPAKGGYRVQADTISETGQISPWPQGPVIGPLRSVWDIKTYLTQAEITLDETLTQKVYLNGAVLTIRKGNQGIQEMKFTLTNGRGMLNCEERKEIGTTVCTCSK